MPQDPPQLTLVASTEDDKIRAAFVSVLEPFRQRLQKIADGGRVPSATAYGMAMKFSKIYWNVLLAPGQAVPELRTTLASLRAELVEAGSLNTELKMDFQRLDVMIKSTAPE